jgi:2-oxoglutarate dehydrogenase E2 component (dihydrolipoamide succinyltransferase)
MKLEITVPSVGESITEAVLAQWFKKSGDFVTKDEPLFVIETDKVTLEVTAEASGRLEIGAEEGDTVAIGAVVGVIDTDQKPSAADAQKSEAPEATAAPQAAKQEKPPEAVAQQDEKKAPAAPKPAKAPADGPLASPSVRKLVAVNGLDITAIEGSGPAGRTTKADVWLYMERHPAPEKPSAKAPATAPTEAPAEVRKAMSPIRRRIAERLLDARRNTAMLTTFNEIDMARSMAVRGQYKEAFKEKHGVSLGFMSFFTRACVEALAEIPEINAFIDGDDIIYHNHCHVGIAIGSDRGLVVPVIRNCEQLSFAQIEQAIVDYVKKIRNNRLELSDLEGGTFTISNGGVYGSLLSTPILNTPQSGILGMHKIEKRPVVVDDQVVIRPMMYVALSYDHRIVDGQGAVTFLKRVKEYVENPERIMLEV